MNINVKLYATLRKHLPDAKLGAKVPMEVKGKTTVEDVINKLGIEKEQAKIILVNGIHQDVSYKLQKGDLLVIFPPVGGG